MQIQIDKIDNNTRKYLFGTILGIPYVETTPDWNINHYSTLLKYTNHSVLRRKHLRNLKWWLNTKKQNEEIYKKLFRG